MNILPAVAKNVYVYCKKCETDRYFRVLAHVSATEAKLECEVCGSKRKLKLGETEKKTTTKKKTTRKKSVNAHLKTYNELKEKFGNVDPELYSTAGSFAMDSMIDHPTFGLGIVTQSLHNKIEVCFEEGVKTLMHRRQ